MIHSKQRTKAQMMSDVVWALRSQRLQHDLNDPRTRAAHRTVTAYGRKGTVEDGYGITVPVTVP